MTSSYRYLQLTVLGLAVAAGDGARAQTNTTPSDAADSTNVTDIGTTTVVGHLNLAPNEVRPSLGATQSIKDEAQLLAIPQGDNAPLNQVVDRFPGVTQDSAANGDLHVRGEHANLQYRIDDVLLPDGISGFGLELDPRFIKNISLITGALPAQYGYRTAGVLDIQTKSGAINPGGEFSLYGGSYDTVNPSLEFGGKEGKFNYFVTASYDHNGLGIENPTGSSTPIHDYTQQSKTFLYGSYIIDDSSRVTTMASASYSQFEVPNRPSVPAGMDTNGVTWASAMGGLLPGGTFNSAALNERQKEQNYFGVVTYQKSAGDLDWQTSILLRRSEVAFTPDEVGDLYFNGEASSVDRALDSVSLQSDASYHLGEHHVIRAGLLANAEAVSADSSTRVFNLNASGDPTNLANIVDNHPLYAQFAGVYLQDEWKLTSKLTLNYGARFDIYSSSFDAENQFSPRANLVYQPFDGTTLHAGYSRYFTPPPVEDVGGTTLSKFANTSGAPGSFLDSPVRAERANYYDVGVSQKIGPHVVVGLDGYYKIAQNQLDDGLFGQTLILSAFNYARGEVHGLEFTGSYTDGGFSAYANIANCVAKGKTWNSSQFLFSPADLAYVNKNWIYLDHDQDISASFGLSYLFTEGHGDSTLFYADTLYGTGLRTDATGPGGENIPNGGSVPSYYSVNIGVEQKFQLAGKQAVKARLDVVNVLDRTYELRDGSGVGVNAAQFGERRGIFGSVSYEF